MPSFRHRSTEKELLDGTGIPFADIRRNMQELNFINQHLGGHAVTQTGLWRLLKPAATPGHLHVVEIGCGGGDNLRAIKRWAAKQNLAVSLTGIDWNEECIAFSKSVPGNTGIRFIHADYRSATFSTKPDVIFSSLFCHHFSNIELVEQLGWMKANSKLGFFMNDLHRHPLAYYSIKWLTALFSKSYLVKNDAPLSVLRGFKRKEWEGLFRQANIQHYDCRWRWAFRWLVLYQHAD
jgi:2-polyprenyl-3-methyl-5-hydroxy-6-metoxy-1,4-benzoquinol methylase